MVASKTTIIMVLMEISNSSRFNMGSLINNSNKIHMGRNQIMVGRIITRLAKLKVLQLFPAINTLVVLIRADMHKVMSVPLIKDRIVAITLQNQRIARERRKVGAASMELKTALAR